jgi:hypothetical protein
MERGSRVGPPFWDLNTTLHKTLQKRQGKFFLGLERLIVKFKN